MLLTRQITQLLGRKDIIQTHVLTPASLSNSECLNNFLLSKGKQVWRLATNSYFSSSASDGGGLMRPFLMSVSSILEPVSDYCAGMFVKSCLLSLILQLLVRWTLGRMQRLLGKTSHSSILGRISLSFIASLPPANLRVLGQRLCTCRLYGFCFNI